MLKKPAKKVLDLDPNVDDFQFLLVHKYIFGKRFHEALISGFT